MQANHTTQRATPANSPTAWFAALERARLTDNRELAVRARKELKRLGVSVRFCRRKETGVNGE